MSVDKSTVARIAALARIKLSEAELMERRSIQDWVVRPMLRSIAGGIASFWMVVGLVKRSSVILRNNSALRPSVVKPMVLQYGCGVLLSQGVCRR